MNVGMYLPAAMFVVGAALTFVFNTPDPTPLPRPLEESIPSGFMDMAGIDVPIDTAEQRTSGVTHYLNRAFDIGVSEGPMLMYIGYHATQQGEYRIHSPTVCLPGAGWTPVSSKVVSISVGDSLYSLNRYVLQRDEHRILVYYWFQGRGRVTSGQVSTFRLSAMRDVLLSGRDEETLARIVIPLPKGSRENDILKAVGLVPDSLATQFASELIPVLADALPAMP